MASLEGPAIIGINTGNRGYIAQFGVVTLVGATAAVTLPQLVPAGTGVNEIFVIVSAQDTSDPAATLDTGVNTKAVSAAGLVTFNIEGNGTETVAFVAFTPR